MSRPAKLLLGAATMWPVLYLVLFIGAAFFSIFFGQTKEPTGIWAIIIPLHLLTMIFGFGLLAFYVVNLFRNDRIKNDMKALWAIVLFMGAPIAMPIYWYQYVWQDPPQLAGSGRHSSTMEQTYLSERVLVLVGDITEQEVDVIVNAANSSLLGGGGVDGAIHRAGGPSILEECKEIRRTQFPKGLPTGEVVVTSAGSLPAKHVIHTVGPVYGQHGGSEANLLASCYTNSLQLAIKHSLSTIAFPAISTGLYDYPLSEAAEVASKAIKTFLSSESGIKEVRLVFFRKQDAEVFVKHQRFV